jgi:hypothetical protein
VNRESIASETSYDLAAAWRGIAAGWHDFFQCPRDTRPAALVRIAYAALVLMHWAVLYPDLDRWYADGGVMSATASQAIKNPHTWSLLWALPATSTVVHVCFWIALVNTALLLVGFLSRINAALLLVWLISFQNRNPLILDGEDALMRLLALYLVLMPCGASLSLDSLLWRRTSVDPLLAPGWGTRLLQIQMAAIYFTAALYKLGAEPWLDGTAMYYVARLDDYFGRFPVPTWLFDSRLSVALMTWAVVAGELLVPIFVWFRQTRRWALAVAVLFHLANEWTMHLFLFHWLMLAGWLAFVEPADWQWLGKRAESRAKRAEGRGQKEI